MLAHASLTRIRSWLHTCDTQHAFCDASKSQLWCTTQATQGILLIDVRELCLVSFELGMRYVALSYVCGPKASFRNTIDRLPELAVPGALCSIFPELPLTVRQAVRLARAVGERYLWADTPCIVAETKVSQLRSVHDIYRAAAFTIVASDGARGSSGLLPRKMKRRTNRRPQEGPAGAAWLGRAWTLQEWLMSRRILLFSGAGIYFHCPRRASLLLVPGTLERPIMRETIGVFRKQWYKFHFACVDWLRSEEAATDPSSADATVFELYKWLVKAFTQRRLSFGHEILEAFHGLEIHMGRTLNCTMVQGLPGHPALLPGALLWSSAGAAQDRVRRVRRVGFPSWSWAGHLDAVTYDHAPKLLRSGGRSDMRHPGCVKVASAVGPAPNTRDRRAPPPMTSAPVRPVAPAVELSLEEQMAIRYLQITSFSGTLWMEKKGSQRCVHRDHAGEVVAEILYDVPSTATETAELVQLIAIPQSPCDVSVREDRIAINFCCDETAKECPRSPLSASSPPCWVLAHRWCEERGLAERIGIGWICGLFLYDMEFKIRTVLIA